MFQKHTTPAVKQTTPEKAWRSKGSQPPSPPPVPLHGSAVSSLLSGPSCETSVNSTRDASYFPSPFTPLAFTHNHMAVPARAVCYFNTVGPGTLAWGRVALPPNDVINPINRPFRPPTWLAG